MQAEFISICRSLFTTKITDGSVHAQSQDLHAVVQKSVWSRARAIRSITCMQAAAYGLCCNIIPYYLLPHLIPTAQLWNMMWDMDLYPETNMLTVSMCTYHLPSTYH